MVHMFGWLKRWFSPQTPSFPAVETSLDSPTVTARRLKTYQAESGYVYQYTFSGRHCKGRETEFVFSVSVDRKDHQRVAIVLPDAAIAPFEKTAGRRLAENERYGVAKIALFRLFDAKAKPAQVWDGTRIDDAQAREYIGVLGL